MVLVRTYWETVTRDGDGQTVEGTHGVVMPNGDYIDMAGVTGSFAAALLDSAAVEMPASKAVEYIRDTLGVLDHVDERTFELIAYGADLPDVGDDVPYIRSVGVDAPDRLIPLIADRLESLAIGIVRLAR